MKIKRAIYEWYRGKEVDDNSPDSDLIFLLPYYQKHWTSKIANVLVKFWLKHWQWIGAAIIAIICAIISA